MEVLPRTQIGASTSSARHPAQLYFYLDVWSSILNWIVQPLYKWDSNPERWLWKSSLLYDKYIPLQYDFLGALEPVSVHAAVSVRTGAIIQQASCQNIFKVVRTHFYSSLACSSYIHRYSIQCCSWKVLLLQISLRTRRSRLVRLCLACTFQGIRNPGANDKFDFVPDSSHGDLASR